MSKHEIPLEEILQETALLGELIEFQTDFYVNSHLIEAWLARSSSETIMQIREPLFNETTTQSALIKARDEHATRLGIVLLRGTTIDRSYRRAAF